MPSHEVRLELVTRGEGHTVARLAGSRMPVLIVHHEAVRQLRVLFDAAMLRVRALPDSEMPDALAELKSRFESLLSFWEVEGRKYEEWLMQGEGMEERLKVFESDKKTLSEIVSPLKGES